MFMKQTQVEDFSGVVELDGYLDVTRRAGNPKET